MNKPGSFERVDNKASLAPMMQVSIRHGAIAFSASTKGFQAAKYVQIFVDARYKRLAFLLTPHQGDGNFALSTEGKGKLTKVVTCVSLLKAYEWIAAGRYDAKVDHRGYWIIEVGS